MVLGIPIDRYPDMQDCATLATSWFRARLSKLALSKSAGFHTGSGAVRFRPPARFSLSLASAIKRRLRPAGFVDRNHGNDWIVLETA